MQKIIQEWAGIAPESNETVAETFKRANQGVQPSTSDLENLVDLINRSQPEVLDGLTEPLADLRWVDLKAPVWFRLRQIVVAWCTVEPQDDKTMDWHWRQNPHKAIECKFSQRELRADIENEFCAQVEFDDLCPVKYARLLNHVRAVARC